MPRKKQTRGKAGARIEDLVPMSVDERRNAMVKVAEGMSLWRPARQVLRRVRALPTIFPLFDFGTRVGGLPLDRAITIHGPSNEGKTIFTLGLILSFLKTQNFVAYIDSEMTTPITWCEKLMSTYVDSPGYLALRPQCFEEAVEATKTFLTLIQKAKELGTMPADLCGLVVVDSVKKLVPRNLLEKLLSEGIDKHGIDGMRGRGAQYKAALNSQWLDSLVPLLHNAGSTAALVARESSNPDASADDRKYNRPNSYLIQGGGSIIYDASLVARVERDSWVMSSKDKDGKPIGERIRVQIWKTKVGGKEDKVINTYFHTSNGTFVPEGFDTPRDVLELAVTMEIVTLAGASYSFAGERIGQGMNQAVKRLHNQQELFNDIEKRVRAGFVIEGQEPELEDEEPTQIRRKKKAISQ